MVDSERTSGITSQKPTHIEEEQLELLGKMLLYSVNTLSAREREVYDLLVEGLSRKINRLHRLERQTSRIKVQPGEPDPEVKESKFRRNILRNLRPEEVVKKFIESWENGDFRTEYDCLSSDCKKGDRRTMNLEQYVEKRKAKWENRNVAGIRSKKLKEISSCDLRGNRAEVCCVEEHQLSKDTDILWRQYDLIFENGAWRILNFSTIRKVSR